MTATRDAVPRPTRPGCPVRTATGAAAAACRCSARGSCAAAGVIAAALNMIRRGQHAMVTPPDIEAQILRYYHAEKWTVGTIARQLHVHHSVVRRVLAQAGLPRIGARRGRRRSTPICRSSARRWRSSRR